MARSSAFDILGPVMVGPSSSHTAGALRCASVAASLMEARIVRATFTLFNSFSHTYRGHGTDRALIAGILGLAPDDERIRDAFSLADEHGLSYRFVEGGDDASMHPNTVDIAMEDETGAQLAVRGESLGGGRVRASRIDGVDVDISGEYDTLFVVHRDQPGVLSLLTHLLAGVGINIAFMRSYRTERGGRAYTVFEMDDLPDAFVLDQLRGFEFVRTATLIHIPGAGRPATGGAEDDITSGTQLLAACASAGCGIGALTRRREEALIGASAAQSSMARVIEVMREETTRPIKDPQRSMGGLIGGEAQLVARADKRTAAGLMGAVQTDAVARAMAVLERSASMGVIVAAPTAGSAGVVPGCLLAAADHLGADGLALADALYAAAGVGMLLARNASVSGAEGGCQAEVGSASAMAAAALVELFGGAPHVALAAASVALGNLLGLVCDPVGGLVEVPCQQRNAAGVANAFSAAQLALSGVKPLVPFDEAAHAMLVVGRSLPPALRETALGGLAAEPSARAACASCRACG